MDKLKVYPVMLPTKNNSRLFIRNGEIEYASTGALLAYDPPKWLTQHLYFISDIEIKEGDWVLEKETGKVTKIVHTAGVTKYGKKIEATTDPLLGLPFIPQSFIDEYVKAQGEIEYAYQDGVIIIYTLKDFL